MKVRVRKRTAAIVTVALVSAGVTTAVVISSGAASRKPAPQATGPVQGQVHSIDLRGNGTTAAVSAPSTAPFSMLGVAWNEATAHLVGSVKVRTRSASTGTWSAWRPVTVDNDDIPSGTRERSRQGATSPLWTGPSNGVDVRVAGRRTLPAGLRVMLVDPGSKRQQQVRADGHEPVRVALAADTTGPVSPSAAPTDSPSGTPSDSPSGTSSGAPTGTPSSTPSDTSAPAPTPTATTPVSSTAPRPTIVSRAGWGADESLVKGPPSYGQQVKVVFVHHTDTGNSYSCSDSAAVVRSVMLYHVNVDGWDDIGYNFLVDKCGKLFEGRAGGVDRPVIGAHSYGFNTNSAGVAVLGTYASSQEAKGGVAPTQAALDTVAKVAAWKLGLSGRNPTGSDTLVEGVKDGNFPYNSNVTFKRISGHRDANSTACPGQYLYDKLGTIRTEAGSWATPADLSSVAIAGATKVGSTYYTKGTVGFGWKPAAVKGYDLLDNGTVISHLSASATSAATTLTAGTHQLQLRATNINGTTAQSPVFTVIADTTKPVFRSSAALTLRAGTVSASQVPVSLTWKATDDRLLYSVKATKPSAKTFTATTTSWSAYAHPSTSTLWSLTAADAAGNTATSSVTRTAWIKSESSATRTGVWTTASASGYLGGKALSSTKLGATASWTITGRSVGLITKRATNTGKFSVYVDGVYAATIDTKSSSSLYRQIQWTKTWSTSGRHTIKIRVAATSGRPTVAIDGLAYIA